MKLRTFLITILTVITFVSCKKDGSSAPQSTPNFTTSYPSYFLNQPITFNSISSNATSYKWDFGDGQSSTEAAPQHSFTTAGKYKVTLSVDNKAPYSKAITIRPASKAYVIVNAGDATMFNVKTYVGYTSTTDGTFDRTFGDILVGGKTDTIYTDAPNVEVVYNNQQILPAAFTLFIYSYNILSISAIH